MHLSFVDWQLDFVPSGIYFLLVSTKIMDQSLKQWNSNVAFKIKLDRHVFSWDSLLKLCGFWEQYQTRVSKSSSLEHNISHTPYQENDGFGE